MVVKGMVESIVFQNKENGYTVANVECNGEKTIIVGKLPSLFVGNYIEAVGHFISNNKYGEQFAVESYELTEPNTEEDIEKYLSSGLIQGVGPATAKNIVHMFGKDTLQTIELNPLKLSSVRGVSLKKAAEIGQTFLELRRMQDAVMLLQKYNVSVNLAVKIYNFYGDATKSIVQKNPYKLVEDIRGIGFRTADKIAKSIGIEPDSEFRIRAGLVFALTETSEKEGNTYLPKEMLIKNLSKLLELDLENKNEVLANVFGQLILEGFIKEMKIDGEDCIMLVKYFLMEQRIANKLLMLEANDTYFQDIGQEIMKFEEINDVQFHSEQKKAIDVAVNSGVAVITGGPGTGKTTIIKCILGILRNQKKVITLLAPTGRAAKRMNESCNEEASTIHRALMIDFNHGGGNDDESIFFYNEHNPLPTDVVIVDEVSMVDVNLMCSLMNSLKPSAKLILVGDKNQLPSVGAGNILADILSSRAIPSVSLTKIYRQSEKSLIISNAHAINNGEMPLIDNTSSDFFFEKRNDTNDILRTILDLQVSRIPRFLDIEPQKIQVLAPMRAGVCGVENLNSAIQNILNPKRPNVNEICFGDTIFREGDKVMHTQNNYSLEWKRKNGYIWEHGEAVFNGDMGVITNVETDAGSVEVTFEDGRIADYTKSDLGQLALSYAITIHKSQGSEFDVVIMPIIGGTSAILTRNLLYTAVTRAKKMVVLVGQLYNLKLMVTNNYTARRYTALNLFLIEQKKKLEEFKR